MGIFDSFGMTGIVKSNLSVYFDLRKDGFTHKDALSKVLESRYPFERGKYQKVLSQWQRESLNTESLEKSASSLEKDELLELIQIMYLVEVHLDDAGLFIKMGKRDKLSDKFDELYNSIKVKYSRI